MTHTRHEVSSPEEKLLVERVGSLYAPEPRSPVQRVLFREALEERLAVRPAFGWELRPTFAAAVAVVLMLFALVATRPPATLPSANPTANHGDTLVTLALGESDLGESSDMLPDDYAALADVLDL